MSYYPFTLHFTKVLDESRICRGITVSGKVGSCAESIYDALAEIAHMPWKVFGITVGNDYTILV